ncbi:hypothetical protein WAE58_21815 [Pedobacter panaciterrae]|uniref:PKD/Chitinase domain-containing protein n=1 Tax=Pedobacter panaciterrae TaxID=363849 RepID=A0ABU8NS56_9SPHI
MQVFVHGDLSGQYKIGGLDLWDNYNYFIETGSDDLLQLYKSKEVYSHDWKGQNGKQYDLSKRFFEDKIVTLSGYLIANTKEQFWTKYLAIWDLFKSPGSRLLYSNELEQTFSVFYLDSPNPKRFTRLQEFPDKVVMKLDIQLQVMFMEFESPSSVPQPPIVNAGGNKTITLPTNQLTISGASATPKGGATIIQYSWEYNYSIPNGLTATLTLANTISPKVADLNTPGVYHFFFTAVDSNGKQSSDNMTITVLPEPVSNNSFPYTLPFNLA